MPPSRRAWTDAQMQLVISALLRAGVVTASTIVLAGGIYYLIRHGADLPNYQVFHGEPTRLRSPSGIVTGALSLHVRDIIQLGLFLLIITPVARVAFSVVAFTRQRDLTYVVMTLIVLAVLIYNLVAGYL